jgi:SNF2 family DNA or RNA helicase
MRIVPNTGTVEITTDGKRILCRFSYDRELVRKVKTVPGSRWHPETKTWRSPLTMDTCRMYRRVFKDQLDIKPPLAEWAKQEKEREGDMEAFREGTGDVALSRLEEEAPTLLAAMQNRKYQIAGTGFLLGGRYVALADDPGLGKTIQTLAAIIESDAKRILVACRRTAAHTVWELETLRWAPGIEPFVAQGLAHEREAEMQAFTEYPVDQEFVRKMLIVNSEMVRAKRIVICPQGLGDKCPAYSVGECKHKFEAEYKWPFLFEQQWDAIVFDESHNLLASTANYQSKRITQARYGAVILRRKLVDNGLAVALSGTWTRSNLTKAWGTLNWLRPDVFGSYWNWAGIHFGVEEGTYGKIVADGAKVPEPLDSDAWDSMLRPYVLRREKREAAPDLPPIEWAGTPINGEGTPNYVQIEMEPAQQKLYKQMVEDAEAELENGSIKAIGVLAEITRLRQFASSCGELAGRGKMLPALPSNKIEWIQEFMSELKDTGKKVVIASSFSELVELTASELREYGFEVLTLTGSTPDRARSALVARFQDMHDDLQVVVINRKAGGESITLDAADYMIVMDPPWISDDDEQLTARIHRVSRIHNVTVYRLISTDTVEEWIAGMTDAQREALGNATPQKLSEKIREAAAS